MSEAPRFVHDGPRDAPLRLALAHGAGAPMDSPFLEQIATGLAARGVAVSRFEFPYMAARRAGGRARPPDRSPRLIETWHAVVDALGEPARLVIGGKSLGGRIATMIADDAGIAGCIALGYPFHPPREPDRLRIDHLRTMRTRCRIVQGERDPFGSRDEVLTYPLAAGIEIRWLTDGDHSFKPRRSAPVSEADNLAAAIELVHEFIATVAS